MWIGLIGAYISSSVAFIIIVILIYGMLNDEKSGETKWRTNIIDNIFKIGFICFVIFILIAIIGALCDSELGRMILNK